MKSVRDGTTSGLSPVPTPTSINTLSLGVIFIQPHDFSRCYCFHGSQISPAWTSLLNISLTDLLFPDISIWVSHWHIKLNILKRDPRFSPKVHPPHLLHLISATTVYPTVQARHLRILGTIAFSYIQLKPSCSSTDFTPNTCWPLPLPATALWPCWSMVITSLLLLLPYPFPLFTHEWSSKFKSDLFFPYFKLFNNFQWHLE